MTGALKTWPLRGVAALDIGGTKLAAALVDDTGQVGQVARADTPAHDRAACRAEISRLLEPLLTHANRIAVCSAGPFDLDGLPEPVNLPALSQLDLVAELGRLSGLPVSLINDAQALALAEGQVGAARGVRNHAVVTISTGVGAGIVLDGRLLEGATGNAGHWGHVVVAPDGPVCGCGRRGCIEAMASGTAIERATGRPAAQATPELITSSGALLGRSLVELATLLDLQQVTLAGSVALGWGEPYRAAVEAALQAGSPFAYVRRTQVRLSTLGVTSGLIGAALHARTQLVSRDCEPVASAVATT